MTPELDGEVAHVFGDAARAIEPRSIPEAALPVDSGEPPWDDTRVRVAFRGEALESGEHERLAAVPGARVRELGSGETLLECGASDLAELEGTTAAVLHAAHENATSRPRSPVVVGVINATPDSFSDGGLHDTPERAAAAAVEMVEAGAGALDVGGESTRPGSKPVSHDVELARVVPVVEAIRAAGVAVPISIDTRRSLVAARALEVGATAINDVSAGRDDPEMLPLAADRACPYTAMHMLGSPRDMQRNPRYDDPVREICAWLRERASACLQAGIELHNITLDPGIGFGKRVQDNVTLIRRLPELRSLGRPLLVGVSRKAYLGRLTGEDVPHRRSGATAAAVALAVAGGAELLRVHDVDAACQAVAVAAAGIGRYSPTPGETT